jgi:hypothetical protein
MAPTTERLQQRRTGGRARADDAARAPPRRAGAMALPSKVRRAPPRALLGAPQG